MQRLGKECRLGAWYGAMVVQRDVASALQSRPCKTRNPLFLNEVMDISDGQILRVSI